MWCRHGTKFYTVVDDVICTKFMKLSVSKVHNIKNLCRSKGLYGYYTDWSNLNFDILEIHLESIFFFLISSDQNLYTLDYRDKSLQPALSNYNKNIYNKELVKLSDINFLEQNLIWVPEIKLSQHRDMRKAIPSHAHLSARGRPLDENGRGSAQFFLKNKISK